tara:strand:+ start:351 stop:1229 length:879 start_codon:yes stop_codon:yes gene_type:complete
MDKKLYYTIITLLAITIATITVIAIAPPNGHESSQIDFTQPTIPLSARILGPDGVGGTLFLQEGGKVIRIKGGDGLIIDQVDMGDELRLKIDFATGNVGIGVDQPLKKLHIKGQAFLETDQIQSFVQFKGLGENIAYMGISKDGGLLSGITDGDTVIRAEGGNLQLGTDLGKLTIRADGNVQLSKNFHFSSKDTLAQIQAQAFCTASNIDGEHTFAIARSCTSTSSQTCEQLCKTLSEPQVTRRRSRNLQCFNSIHIYNNQPHDGLSQVGLKTLKYGSCTISSCGPNYCCCR